MKPRFSSTLPIKLKLKTLASSLLILSIFSFSNSCCSSLAEESRDRWLDRGRFVKGPSKQLEGTYENTYRQGYSTTSLWWILNRESSPPHKISQDGKVLITIKGDNIEFTLFNDNTPINTVNCKISDKGNFYTIGSKAQLHGIPPLLWGLSDREVGLAIDQSGNLHTYYGITGSVFVGFFGTGAGDANKISTIHKRLP